MRAAAQGAVPLHVLHAAVEPGFEPAQQVALVLGDVDAGNAKLAESQLQGLDTQLAFDRIQIRC